MGCPMSAPPGTCGAIIASSSRGARFRTGSRRGEKRAVTALEREYLDQALAHFSGYIAVDELYDGPFCVLTLVDNHTHRRLMYEVLRHHPTQVDVQAFLARFEGVLRQRGLRLQGGVTTDGYFLY